MVQSETECYCNCYSFSLIPSQFVTPKGPRWIVIFLKNKSFAESLFFFLFFFLFSQLNLGMYKPATNIEFFLYLHGILVKDNNHNKHSQPTNSLEKFLLKPFPTRKHFDLRPTTMRDRKPTESAIQNPSKYILKTLSNSK